MTTLLLVRHAATADSGERRFIGQVDPPLGETGRHQAERIGSRLAGVTLAGIFYSDLKRARQTAECIGRFHPVAVAPLPVLREIDLGAWDGEPMARIKASEPQAWADRGEDFRGFRPPGGESFADLQRRVVPALEDLAQKASGTLLLVTHAGVIRVFLSHVMGRSLQTLFGIEVDYGAVTRVDYNDGTWRLKAASLPVEDLCKRESVLSGSNGCA